MARKRTSKVRRMESGPRGVNLRPTTGRVLWCRAKAGTSRVVKWVLVFAILAIAVAAGRSALQQVFLESEDFTLERVELRQWDHEDAPRLIDTNRLAAITGLDPTASIFAFQLNELEEKLTALPEIKRVRATRRMPNVLRIRIEERVPVAWVESPRDRIVGRSVQQGLLVDEEGVAFRPSRSMLSLVSELPVITTGEREGTIFREGEKVSGREFLRALELLKLAKRYLEPAGWSLPAVGLRNDYSLLAKTHTGTSVTFGLYEHERQIKDLLYILQHARETSRGLTRVNLIPERNIPVVFTQSGGNLTAPRSALESNLEAILTRS
ncbi:cell division protein FtsQ/DivIB [Roseibacillus ishigakijimensis]|uniref:FtsQ-type POTRA domain-containing protein n=1 Tax=Roseibacillus ishigakijimensis TaxID=454146 RepID=A0A934RNB8_9BACT|nr:FtsQ-type POTRA domain-containing protein [Roseibacillus ishigakijimensis]MBK1832812.1 FtsQ-type POTRA domain-containing protein [Roseibacillus ishigakijimensis]